MEKHPYGYSQVESLFLLVKYSVLLALTCNLLVENVKLLMHGGHEVNAGKIAVFEFLVCIGCAAMYLILNHYSKKYESETIKAELYMWKLDVVSSLGVAVTTDARGSVTLGDFAKELPAQFVECGIAEQDAVGISR